MSIQEQKITDAAIAASGVQSQPDKLTGTAAQNKAVFDRLVTAVVKERFNALLDELTGGGCAAQLGVETIPGLSAETVQAALEQIMTNMQGITQGGVTDGSVTLAKLAEDVLALINGKQPLTHGLTATTAAELLGSNLTGEMPVYVSNTSKKVTLSVLVDTLKNRLLGTKSITTAMLGDAAVTAAKIAAGAVQATHIAPGAVTGQKIAEKTVQASNLAADAVKLSFINTTVAAASFVSDETYADYPYRAAVTLANVTAAMLPEVIFSAADASSGNFGAVAETYAGGVYIYAAEAPTASVTIPTIIAWR